MPTVYEDQFFTVDPGAPPSFGTPLTFQIAEFIDENDSGTITTNTGDTWDGHTISSVWQNDTLTVNVPGVGNVTYTGVTFYFTDGSPAVFTPTDGQVLQNGTFVSSTYVTTATQTPVGDFGPTCFVPGMMIDTPEGPRPVEDLRAGDLVLTMDDGPQMIRFVADERFDAREDHAPVRFAPGAIGNSDELIVSPLHRVLITGWQAEMFYGRPEVLVAAKHLVNGTTVTREPAERVRYIHLLFDRHQIIWSQGVPSESFYPVQAIEGMNARILAAVMRQFPGFEPHRGPEALARPEIGRREAALLAAA